MDVKYNVYLLTFRRWAHSQVQFNAALQYNTVQLYCLYVEKFAFWLVIYIKTFKSERAEMAAVSCGTSHASAVSTPLRWIFKKRAMKKLFTHVESHASTVSLLESGE